MGNVVSRRLTLGVLSTWSIYEGTTIDRYAQTLFQGMCAAAKDNDCHLLLGCGISLPDSPRASRTAWSMPGPDADFIPVGPWNTDGLIIIPDDLSDVQSYYLQELMHSGFPIVSTTSEMSAMSAPFVAVDNDRGIRQAMDHLLQHGHRQIAFIAGKFGRRGESAERLAVYRASLQAAGLPEDPRLIAYGEHRREGGRAAMEHILRQAVPFTAVLASNDLSALGAIEALEAADRSIPHDVAVMGFDDILDPRSHVPPLSTVQHPTFAIGYQSVELLLEVLAGKYAMLLGQESKPNDISAISARFGQDFAVKPIGKSFLTTSSIQQNMNAIVRTTQHPDKALQFLNLLNTDPVIFNLLAHGIEGKHYVFTDKAKKLIAFPSGVTSSNSGYNPSSDWMFGNEQNGYYTDPKSIGIFDGIQKANAAAKTSTAFGFVFDPTPVKTEIAQLAAILDAMTKAINSGRVNPDTDIQPYLDQVKQAGSEKVVAEVQKQVDAWSKTQKS